MKFLILLLISSTTYAQYSVSVGKANETKQGILLNPVGCDNIPSSKKKVYSAAISKVNEVVKNDFLSTQI